MPGEGEDDAAGPGTRGLRQVSLDVDETACYDSAGEWASDGSDGLPPVLPASAGTRRDPSGFTGRRTSRLSRAVALDDDEHDGRDQSHVKAVGPDATSTNGKDRVQAAGVSMQSAGESALEEERLGHSATGEGTAAPPPPASPERSQMIGVRDEGAPQEPPKDMSPSRAAAFAAAAARRKAGGGRGTVKAAAWLLAANAKAKKESDGRNSAAGKSFTSGRGIGVGTVEAPPVQEPPRAAGDVGNHCRDGRFTSRALPLRMVASAFRSQTTGRSVLPPSTLEQRHHSMSSR